MSGSSYWKNVPLFWIFRVRLFWIVRVRLSGCTGSSCDGETSFFSVVYMFGKMFGKNRNLLGISKKMRLFLYFHICQVAIISASVKNFLLKSCLALSVLLKKETPSCHCKPISCQYLFAKEQRKRGAWQFSKCVHTWYNYNCSLQFWFFPLQDISGI